MRQGILISFGAILLIGVLVILNAVTFVQKEKMPDRESTPNRSTYNTGATGTNAFYSLLSETGHNVIRWPNAPTALSTVGKKPTVFVMIGSLKRDVKRTDIDALMQWVAAGGRLIVIDRDPPDRLVRTSSDWRLSISSPPVYELFSTDPADVAAMTQGSLAAKPAQPGLLTHGITAIQPSRFAGSISFQRLDEAEIHPYYQDLGEAIDTDSAPVAHFTVGESPLVVDVPYRAGKILYLADSFILSNSGVAMADNAKLGVNLVRTDGTIAFDEYHQGYGSGSNRFLEFFAGTPFIPILLQAALLVGLVFYSKSRRFARPVPQHEPDRLSKLEYVSAMAELQQRTRSFDLALENIYGDFRRRVSRQLGLDEATPKADAIARAIAERLGGDVEVLRFTFIRCESIIYGDATNKKEALDLAVGLRELESRLNLQRGGSPAK
jgi:hypothetical protein